MPLGSVDIRNTTRSSAPRIPFEAIARHVLGIGYTLSIVICADVLSRRVNKTFRKKDYSPNVLSFPITNSEGEIFLNVRKAEREARAMGISPRERAAHLFIHGCYHLKGHDHSDKMDALEQKTLRKFRIS